MGPFFEASRDNTSTGSRHTFATVSGFWTEGEGDESSLAGIPHFTDLLVEACGNVLNGSVDRAEIHDFKSTLSLYVIPSRKKTGARALGRGGGSPLC